MKNNIKTMRHRPSKLTSTSLGVVTVTDAGEAKEVYVIDQDITLKVTSHTTNVPFLNVGDEVIALIDKEEVIITHKIRSSEERPEQAFSVNKNGSLTVQNANGIVIQTSQSKIELRNDGSLFIDGKEVYTVSDGVCRIQGATIELN